MKTEKAAQEAPTMTDAERAQRLQAVLWYYEERGWQLCGDPDEDMRQRSILYVMVRAAERAAKEQPSTETVAARDLWRTRLAASEPVPPPLGLSAMS